MSGQAYKHIIMDWIIFSLLKNAAGKHTTELAEEYSREVLSPLLGNDQKYEISLLSLASVSLQWWLPLSKMVAICSMRKLSK